jgi:hypothetical protein
MVPPPDDRGEIDPARSLTPAQQDAFRPIAFFRRQKKVGKGWLVGNKRLSEKILERLAVGIGGRKFRRGAAVLQLMVVGQARLLH